MADMERKPNPSRKQLVGLARDNMLNRTLIIVTASILTVVFGLVAWGLIQERIINPSTVVAVVEGVEITGGEFQSLAKANRQQLVNSYLQFFQNYQLVAGDPGTQQQMLGEMQRIQFQLDPEQIGDSTVNQLVDDRLVILEAQRLGMLVSDEEIEAELQSIFRYFPNGTPVPTETFTPVAISTLSATQYALISATPLATSIPTGDLSTAVANVELLATQNAEATQAASPIDGPEATEFVFEDYQEQLKEYIKLQERELGLDEEGLRLFIRANLYQEALFQYVTADVNSGEIQVWARHILLADAESAREVVAKLEDGEDWNDLALEYSIDQSNASRGGDLGWFLFEDLVEPFALGAFSLRVGETSPPVETSFGWHIIQSLGRENRPLTDFAFANAQNEVFQNFVDELRNNYEWEIIGDNWVSITPDEPDIPSQYKLQQ